MPYEPFLSFPRCFINPGVCWIQGWRQEFSDGGLTLPTRGLKHGFQGTINAKNLRKNRLSLSDGRLACSDGGYSPLALPWRHPWLNCLLELLYTRNFQSSCFNRLFFEFGPKYIELFGAESSLASILLRNTRQVIQMSFFSLKRHRERILHYRVTAFKLTRHRNWMF